MVGVRIHAFLFWNTFLGNNACQEGHGKVCLLIGFAPSVLLVYSKISFSLRSVLEAIHLTSSSGEPQQQKKHCCYVIEDIIYLARNSRWWIFGSCAQPVYVGGKQNVGHDVHSASFFMYVAGSVIFWRFRWSAGTRDIEIGARKAGNERPYLKIRPEPS